LTVSFLAQTPCFGQDAPAAKPQNWTDQPVSDKLIDDAVKKAIDYLFKYQEQSPGGNWETIKPTEYEAAMKELAKDPTKDGVNSIPGIYSGASSLVLIALLKSGVKPDDPHIQKGIKFVMSVRPTQTYGNGLRAALLGTVSKKIQKAYKKEIDYEKQWLMDALFASGTYRYTPPANDGERMAAGGDYSNTQYGVLGMWLLSEIAGMEIKDKYWQVLQEGYLKHQVIDGGWQYGMGDPKDPKGVSSQSMTLGALASLHVIWDKRFTSECNTAAPGELLRAIEKGFDQLGKVYDPTQNPGGPGYGAGLYTLYGTERVAVASGRKYFGTKNWWDLGSKFTLFTQGPEGNWPGSDQEPPNVQTAWALLFLSYGHAPIIINKLNYGGGLEQWNSRPRDLAHVTHWMDVWYERLYNWQYMSIDHSVEELLDAPVLFMSGKVSFKLKDAEKAKLRDYVLGGGMLFGEAADGSKLFGDSFRALARELFPDLEITPLPADHAIYTVKYTDELAKGGKVPPLEAVRNGVRVLMLLSPKDLSCAWQTWQMASQEKAFLLADSITLQYVGDMEKGLLGRGSSYMVRDLGNKPATAVTVGRLVWGGNRFSWDPEPAAWTRLDVKLRNAKQLAVTTQPCDFTKPVDPKVVPIVHITGTKAITLEDDQKANLQKYVNDGGLIFSDAAGGNERFDESYQKLIGKLFGPLRKATPDFLPLAVDAKGEVELRHYDGLPRVSRKLKLLGWQKDGRWAVLHVPYDVTGAMVGYPCFEPVGLTPPSAEKFMLGLLKWVASGQSSAASASPAASQPTP
jgi:hypothetical protein